jgi:predicted RNA-binding protein associated with RNAse of E/G family
MAPSVRTALPPWARGDVIALRYVSTDARIEICWPCRVVSDTPELLVVFIAVGTRYRAEPKRSAAERRRVKSGVLPSHEYEWRKDALRLMLPGQSHSVLLFWDGRGDSRHFTQYFVNMEEPFRRTAVGVDTQDHTLDIVVRPDFRWTWRDEDDLAGHVKHGFYTAQLAEAARSEGERAIQAITDGTHPCVRGWDGWLPDPTWEVPALPAGWDTEPLTFWDRRLWAYADDCGGHQR